MKAPLPESVSDGDICAGRREFLKKTAMASGAMAMPPLPGLNYFFHTPDSPALAVNLFSKHLHFLGWQEVGSVAADLGFSGIDLTVRPEGHVLPENVEGDLPKALAQIRNAGISCELISTDVSDADAPEDLNVLRTAAANGIKYYRSAWFPYKDDLSMPEAIEFYRARIDALATLNRKLGLTGCYQNHAGRLIGASPWEIHQLLATADPSGFGIQYDIRHATVEGGLSWKNGLRLLKNHIKTIGLKDFKWALEDGEWRVVNTPVGEGMVDFKGFFRILKEENIRVPAVLYMEYPLGGAEHGNKVLTIDRELVFRAMRTDLKRINTLWKEA